MLGTNENRFKVKENCFYLLMIYKNSPTRSIKVQLEILSITCTTVFLNIKNALSRQRYDFVHLKFGNLTTSLDKCCDVSRLSVMYHFTSTTNFRCIIYTKVRYRKRTFEIVWQTFENLLTYFPLTWKRNLDA